VFTARYALSPYIKQVRFIFKGLNAENQTQNFSGINLFKLLSVCLLPQDIKMYALLTLALTTHWTVRASNHSGGETFRTRPGRSRGQPSVLGTVCLSRGKPAKVWRWPTFPCSTNVAYGRTLPPSLLRALMAHHSVTFAFTSPTMFMIWQYKYFTCQVNLLKPSGNFTYDQV
jgi:hypothetical protein